MTATECFLIRILSDHLASRRSVSAPIDETELRNLASAHQINGIVYDQCKDLLSASVSAELDRRGAAEIRAYMSRVKLFEDVAAAFSEAGIPFYTVKGLDLAALYPKPPLRTMGDCDLVVHEEDKPRAHEVLLGLGFRNGRKGPHEWTYFSNGLEFELHHRFSQEDLDIFRRRGLWAVTCPASNAKLASGIAPIEKMRAMGIPLAIGTDGPASNNALNMFREMYLVTVLQKLQLRDAAVCDAASVLRMACSGGAAAMGLDADCLAPGKLADLVVIDLDQPNMYPEHNIVKNLVYSGSSSNVRLTMVGGKVLYEDGQFFVGETPEAIYRRAQRSAERLTKA